MTTITIERALLEQVQEFLYRVTHWKGGNHEELTDLHDMKETIKAALVAPAAAPDELERLRQIAHLTGTIFCYGNFVAETHNEAVLEKLLRENGTFWDSVEQYEKSQGWIP